MRQHYKATRSRKGMAMLVVLFIVMAIAIISAGFIARSDMALACGRNYCLRAECDYAAWGGLEVAWALAQDPNSVPYSHTQQSADWGTASSDLMYDLTIGSDKGTASDPNVCIYPVMCEAYQWIADEKRAVSRLYGDLQYDADSGQAYYLSIRREE